MRITQGVAETTGRHYVLRVKSLLGYAHRLGYSPLNPGATGKGGVVRQVLLPAPVSRSLLALRGDTGANDSVFASRKTGAQLGERAILGLVKRAAARAGLEAPVSPHWLRHAHASHAIDRGATLPEVQSTLGYDNIATTSGYLHARPESSSGLKLDPGCFFDDDEQ
jgi:integrase/recombinase XerD